MTGILILVFILFSTCLFYHRASVLVWLCSLLLFNLFVIKYHGLSFSSVVFILLNLVFILFFCITAVRLLLITKPIFNIYRAIMPVMSKTEKEAINAGTVSWEGELFQGNPNWHALFNLPKPILSAEEQAFLDGPTETLCQMLDDWKITQHQLDLSKEVWQFIKDQGFFALIIPKKYGGRGFSAYAHSEVLVKISSCSITASSTIAVPNSLGPAELLLEYGTEEQKNYYLPRLAKGIDIPCFALTSAMAGSDAGSMIDTGVICLGEHNGKEVLGIKLNFNKRYITLAPIATVIGLAFKLFDPEKLLSDKIEIGITCALIPRETPGITIGRRHFPLNAPFQNGPIQGQDVFIPLDYVIGGQDQIGKGWGMLMECLAAGRAISLPSSALGGAKLASFTTSIYSRIRKQFNVPISRFEGVQAGLARLAAFTYLMDAARTFASSALACGHKPAIASAIVKYHTTEFGRKIAADAMDIHGGKGICLGPKNYLGRAYEAAPIAITVEGANILTRNLIIFGQGVIRCHPFVLNEMKAGRTLNFRKGLRLFDKLIYQHVYFASSNIIRSFILGILNAYNVVVPRKALSRYLQLATRFSSVLAMLSDMCMLYYGGKLKRKENISARLGDILSHLYLISSLVKFYNDAEAPEEDLPIVQYAAQYCLHEIQEAIRDILKNFPNKFLAFILKIIIFPLGLRINKPNDFLQQQIATTMTSSSSVRNRLTQGICRETNPILIQMQTAIDLILFAEPFEKQLRQQKKDGLISGLDMLSLAKEALEKNLLSEDNFLLIKNAYDALMQVLAVDDFAADEL